MITNQWYAILPSKAVGKGKIVSVKRCGLPLALFRTETGELGCLADRCTHRGAALSLGALRGDCLYCPFHALHFDTTGRCRYIPANGKSSAEDLTRYNVTAYLVQEAHGIIYMWYGEPEKATDCAALLRQPAGRTVALQRAGGPLGHPLLPRH